MLFRSVQARGRAAVDRLRERVADVAAVALARVVGVLPVPRPPRVLDAGADPVGVGHDLVEGQRLCRLRVDSADGNGGERGQGKAGKQVGHVRDRLEGYTFALQPVMTSSVAVILL